MRKKRHRYGNSKAKSGQLNGHVPHKEISRKAGGPTLIDVMIFVLVSLIALGLALFGAFYAAHNVASIWLMFGCIVLSALSACLFWQQKITTNGDPNDIRTSVDLIMKSDSNHGSPFVFKHLGKGGQGQVISPLPLALGMTITNTRSTPIAIDSFGIEVKDGFWGKWNPLTNISVTNGQLYWLSNDSLNTAKPIRVDQLEIPLSSPLPSNQPIRGFLFFVDPSESVIKKLVLGKPDTLRWRMKAKDTAGNLYTSDIIMNASGGDASRSLETNLHGIWFAQTQEDLSQLPRQSYVSK